MKSYSLSLIFLLFISSTAFSKLTVGDEKLAIDTLKKEKNYILHSKSENVASVSFIKKAKANTVYIKFGFQSTAPSSSSVAGVVNQNNKTYMENVASSLVFDKIDILSGSYADIKVTSYSKLINLYELSKVEYPLRLKLYSGKERIDLELLEKGEWNIQIDLKNN